MKLSDVLKRKRGGAKRGGVVARKTRTCATDEASPLPTALAGCSMDGHDYLKSGSTPGSSGSSNSNSGGARSKFGFQSAGASSNGTPTSGGSATKASSFLASLNPARWGRSHHHNQPSGAANASGSTASPGGSLLPNVPKSLSSSQLAGNREKVKTWIRDQSVLFLSTYFSPPAATGEGGEPGNGDGVADGSAGSPLGLSVLSELTRLVQRLEEEPQNAKDTLKQIRAIVADSDVSSFEILHSGLIRSLIKYLTLEGPDRSDRLRAFLKVRLEH